MRRAVGRGRSAAEVEFTAARGELLEVYGRCAACRDDAEVGLSKCDGREEGKSDGSGGLHCDGWGIEATV